MRTMVLVDAVRHIAQALKNNSPHHHMAGVWGLSRFEEDFSSLHLPSSKRFQTDGEE